MGRKPRIHRPAAFYHVILRGNNGQNIFLSDADRCRLCLLLQQGVERFGYGIHGFCLMSNHIHLIVQPGVVSLSQIIQHLACRYVFYFNRKYQHVGHLFQGRFKSILVDAENYLSELIRYVHLNPVRAGLVSLPEDYFWSGHRAYMGLHHLTWLKQDWILKKFHTYEALARTLYNDYVKVGIGKEPSQEFFQGWNQGTILGDDDFIEKTLEEVQKSKDREKNIISLQGLTEKVSETLGISLSEFQSQRKDRRIAKGRSILTFLVRQTDHITLKELGNLLGKDQGNLSKMAKTIEMQINRDSELANLVKTIEEGLSKST